MTTKLQDLNRRDIPLQISQIKETLPEYFRSEYPQFITFIEKYYEFLDSDGRYSFATQIHQLFSTRDVDQTPDNLFDLLGKELGSNLASTNIFDNKRYSIRRFGELYRNKGTEKGLEQFFRSFYNVEPTISYPKDNVFTVGSSKIGPDDLKVIQDYERNQTLSILYKTSLDLSTWKDLYEKYVHPAGFYYAADVELVETGIGTFSAPLSLDDSEPGPTITETASITPVIPFQQFTVLVTDELSGIVYRSNPLETVEKYEALTLTSIDKIYKNVAQMFTPNSFKFTNGHKLAFDLQDSTITTQVDQDSHSIGTIKAWNDDSAFSNFEQPRGGDMFGFDSSGYIDSGETIAVFMGNNTSGARSRIFLQNKTVNLSSVKHLTYWANAGIGGAAGWGGTPNAADDLLLQFAKASAPSDFITIDTVDVNGVVLGRWTKRDINIEGVADSNVIIRFQQIGSATTVDRDNWAITSVYIDSSYDSLAPTFDLSFETMDQEMFDSYGKVF